MKNYPKIAIVYLLYYHNESFVDNTVSALKQLTYPKDKVEFIIVNNPHPEHGLFNHYIEETVMPLSGKEIPHVTYMAMDENKGFAGGNNVGGKWAIENGFEYIVYHNNDGFFASNAFEPMVEALERDKQIGAAQSLMLLHPDTEYVNSAGNSFHYLGFGYCDEYRSKADDLDLPPLKEIGYASGACLMIRSELVEKFGGWDHDFFLYHEDLEWSFRLRLAGYKIKLVRDSVFYHQYQFARSIAKFYWMERNRYGTWLMYFRWPTLFVLAPMALFMELGLLVFAIKGGWLGKRMEVYKYWLNKDNWRLWLNKRKKTQKLRKVSDRRMLKMAASGIHFQDKSVDNPLVNYIANPIMKVYWGIVRHVIVW